ncbi:MAG: sulfatase-like hydrolase/transferase [Acidobacteriota bacterium]|nr:sulfatase-like hydrolase/transferase [Acidobacteriota bacterium]
MKANHGTRAAALACAVAACAVGCGTPPGEVDSAAGGEDGRPPNIVLIMADDLGYGDISPYDGWIETPHLDRLAAAGMLLTDFHTSGAVCSPTRAGLVTGRYQHRAGVPAVLVANSDSPLYHQGIDAEAHTIGEAFRELGYTTAVFGKWHLGYLPQFKPPLHGFDEFRGFVSGNIDYQSHVDRMGRPDWWNGETLEDEEGYLSDLIGDHAERFIAGHRDEPFFLYLAHHAPHYPYQGPGDPAERYAGEDTFPGVGAVTDRKRAYREMVESMDASVGRVLDALEEQGLFENTLVWFFSDNGATREGSNGALRGFKASYWEGGHRVPSLATMPGRIAAGSTSTAITSTLDVMPTVLAMAGGAAHPDLPFDGTDIGPVLFDGEDAPPRQLFWSSPAQFWRGAAVRDGRYKLVIDRRTQRAAAAEGEEITDPLPMLFDLEADLDETTDLAADEPQRVEAMMAALERWREDVGAP